MLTVEQRQLVDHPLMEILAASSDPGGGDIPMRAIRWARKRPTEARATLLAVLAEKSLWHHDAPCRGLIPVMAGQLLSALGDDGAVERMLELVSDLELFPRGEPHIQDMWDAVVTMGAVAHQPTVRFYHTHDEPRQRRFAALILGETGCTEPAAFAVFTAELVRSPCMMSVFLAELGDPRAVPHIAAAIDRCHWNEGADFGAHFPGQAMLDLGDAMTALSAELTVPQRDKYDRAVAQRKPSESDRPILIGATTIADFNQQALLHHGSTRRTAKIVGCSPADLWLSAYHCAR